MVLIEEQGLIFRLLYIPIWLYSNVKLKNRDFKLNFFTFQSGYIQIDAGLRWYLESVYFTFQSGYIQMSLALLQVAL